jgi:preprotein translocase subunit SecA
MNVADRAMAALGFRLQQAFGRVLPEAAPRAAAAALPELTELRYRMRRDGLQPALLAQCFALCGSAQAQPADHVLAAARRLVEGGIVELADAQERHAALALAALAHALHGESVHVIAGSEAAAKALRDQIGAALAPLGMHVGCIERGMSAAGRREAYACEVVCGAHREIAQDYLRDRLLAGERRGALSSRLQRLSAAGGEHLMSRGLDCALVEDADLVMLDDAVAPVAIAADVDQSRDRLLYEQALELARALVQDTDFTVEAQGIRLTEPAARLLERLVTPLGGVWSARGRREELVALALEALHLFERDVDYRVANGRVEFPESRKDGEDAAGPDEEIRKLVEVKEGCRLSARRELLARLPMPRFFARYPHLAGVCADARALEAEFWALYSLKTWLAGPRLAAPRPVLRVFASRAARDAALVAAARAPARDVVVAVCGARDAHAAQRLLRDAGLEEDVPIAVLPAVQAVPGRRAACLLIAGLPDSRRHIEQARRACAAERCALLLALDEEAVAPRLGALLAFASRLAVRADGELAPRWASLVAGAVLRAAERASRGARLDQKAREQVLDDLLAISGQRE